MVRKTKEDASRTRELLINSAILTFSRRGYSNTSLDDIAQAANMTRGAIYWHFKNKSELFNAIWQQQLTLKDKISSKVAIYYNDTAEVFLRHSLIEALRLIARDTIEQALVEILYHKCEFTADMTPEAEIRARLFFDRESMALLLKRCMSEHPLFMSGDIELALIIIQAYMSGIIKNWLMLNKSFDLYNFAPRLVDSLLTMLRVTPGNNTGNITQPQYSTSESIISS